MDLGLKGRIAVVTGGSRGLGKASAATLAAEGCRVAIFGRDFSSAERVASELGENGLAFAADLRDRQSVATAFEQVRTSLGDPDILVYNNGGPPDSFFAEATEDEFLEAYRLLILGFDWCVRAVVPQMQVRGWGRIVTMGSICAKEPHRAPFPLLLHNICRPAQVGFSKTLANELGRDGITVNTIGTGTFQSDGTSAQRGYANALKAGMSAEDVVQHRLRTVPAGRFGKPEEYGALCAFLCSDLAGYINGQTVFIDGGRTQGLP